MVKTNYANAYKEVLVILDNLIKEDYDKIPKEYIEFLKSNCNNEYEFYYNTSKPFEEQKLLDDTKYILFGLFEKFGATELQKEKIKSFKDNYYSRSEQEKNERYNPNDVFKKEDKNTKIEACEENINSSLITYKIPFYTRLKNFILKILHINK